MRTKYKINWGTLLAWIALCYLLYVLYISVNMSAFAVLVVSTVAFSVVLYIVRKKTI